LGNALFLITRGTAAAPARSYCSGSHGWTLRALARTPVFVGVGDSGRRATRSGDRGHLVRDDGLWFVKAGTSGQAQEAPGQGSEAASPTKAIGAGPACASPRPTAAVGAIT